MIDFEQPSSSATVAARVNLTPKASQTFLVSLIVLSALCIAFSATLLFTQNDAGWAFLALSIVLAGGGLWGWYFSQPDVDLHSSAPTVISLPDGTSVSTDSRTLRSRDAVAGLLQLCEAYQREVLPDPDGLVKNGVPVPNSAAEAGVQVARINSDVQAQASNFEALVNGLQEGPTMLQIPPLHGEMHDAQSR